MIGDMEWGKVEKKRILRKWVGINGNEGNIEEKKEVEIVIEMEIRKEWNLRRKNKGRIIEKRMGEILIEKRNKMEKEKEVGRGEWERWRNLKRYIEEEKEKEDGKKMEYIEKMKGMIGILRKWEGIEDKEMKGKEEGLIKIKKIKNGE